MADSSTFMSLGVERDAQTNALCLRVLFRQDAPNIHFSKALISWYPTVDEIELLNEAFALIPAKTLSATEPAPSQSSLPLEKKPSADTQARDEFPGKDTRKTMEEERVLVQVDDKLIEEALQRRKADLSKPDADSVVDRLTKKRKLL